MYNEQIFENALPDDMDISWNVRLTKTAGLCFSRRHKKYNIETRSSRIELSTKVIDRGDRLRDTLIHEMCHAASWIISGYRDGHGPLWRTCLAGFAAPVSSLESGGWGSQNRKSEHFA